jgi:phospholipid transport system substrate-binding protein
MPEGNFATVSAKIITEKSTEVPIDYRMLRRGDRWYAHDVRIEGVSLVSNYRSQFNAVIQISSYAKLVQKTKGWIEGLRKES